jgi:hypothetical protein
VRQWVLSMPKHLRIARCLLPKRPGRIEPWAKKRRPQPLALLLVPRCLAREQIRARRAEGRAMVARFQFFQALPAWKKHEERLKSRLKL